MRKREGTSGRTHGGGQLCRRRATGSEAAGSEAAGSKAAGSERAAARLQGRYAHTVECEVGHRAEARRDRRRAEQLRLKDRHACVGSGLGSGLGAGLGLGSRLGLGPGPGLG